MDFHRGHHHPETRVPATQAPSGCRVSPMGAHQPRESTVRQGDLAALSVSCCRVTPREMGTRPAAPPGLPGRTRLGGCRVEPRGSYRRRICRKIHSGHQNTCGQGDGSGGVGGYVREGGPVEGHAGAGCGASWDVGGRWGSGRHGGQRDASRTRASGRTPGDDGGSRRRQAQDTEGLWGEGSRGTGGTGGSEGTGASRDALPESHRRSHRGRALPARLGRRGGKEGMGRVAG